MKLTIVLVTIGIVASFSWAAGLSYEIGYFSQYTNVLGGVAWDDPVVQGSLSGSLPLAGSGGIWASWPANGAPGYGQEVDLWFGGSRSWISYSIYWIAVHPLERAGDDILAPYVSLDPPGLSVGGLKVNSYLRCYHFRCADVTRSSGTFTYGGVNVSHRSELNPSATLQLGWDTGSFGGDEGLIGELKLKAKVPLGPKLHLLLMPARISFPLSGAPDREVQYAASIGLGASLP